MNLAIADAQDAVHVLSAVPNLDPNAQSALNDFISRAPAFVQDSFGPGAGESQLSVFVTPDDRLNELRSLLSTALTSIGSNLGYQIGDAALMF
jgi:hypothetical protein